MVTSSIRSFLFYSKMSSSLFKESRLCFLASANKSASACIPTTLVSESPTTPPSLTPGARPLLPNISMLAFQLYSISDSTVNDLLLSSDFSTFTPITSSYWHSNITTIKVAGCLQWSLSNIFKQSKVQRQTIFLVFLILLTFLIFLNQRRPRGFALLWTSQLSYRFFSSAILFFSCGPRISTPLKSPLQLISPQIYTLFIHKYRKTHPGSKTEQFEACSTIEKQPRQNRVW